MLSSIERGRFGLQKVPFWSSKHGLLQPKSIALAKHVDFCIFCGFNKKTSPTSPKWLETPIYRAFSTGGILLSNLPKYPPNQLPQTCSYCFHYFRKVFSDFGEVSGEVLDRHLPTRNPFIHRHSKRFWGGLEVFCEKTLYRKKVGRMDKKREIICTYK